MLGEGSFGSCVIFEKGADFQGKMERLILLLKGVRNILNN